MRLLKCGIVLIFIIGILCYFTDYLICLISTCHDKESDFYSQLPPALIQRENQIRDSPDHLMWFVQVSDLHLSVFDDGSRGTDLLELCDFTFKHINPSVILVTGDLTDGKLKDPVGSMQLKEEWLMYRNILDKCSTIKKIPWLDLRGNHDNFDVPNVNSTKNLFRKYSVQGRNYSRSYVHKLVVGSEKYAFVGVDACPDVGIKSTFNFGGVLSEAEIIRLIDIHSSLVDFNFTIWFGHYPTSSIISYPEIKSIIASDSKSLAYLSGHFHTIFDLVPEMYVLQKGGFYELELADWKIKRMFRVAAIDHGLFSFVDIKHNEWPIVLVTNPKHALFQSLSREPLNLMKFSTHIRILIFSPGQKHSVRVKIDSGPWSNASHISGPLFVMPWTPSEYHSGVHNIYIGVLDLYGHEKLVIHPFSLDGSKLEFKLLSKLLLMLKFKTVIQVVYFFTVACSVLPLCLLRYINKQVIGDRKLLSFLMKNTFFCQWIRRLWILSNLDSFFYPFCLYPLYISIGPWAFCELVEGRYGLVFIWGIIIDGIIIPDPMTYIYAILQLYLFHGPLILLTAYLINKRLDELSFFKIPSKHLILKSMCFELFFMMLLLPQLMMLYSFYLAYGVLGVILGLFRVLPISLIFWNWYHIKTIPLRRVQKVNLVWQKCQVER